jgi:hypothetical protein
MKSMDNNNCDLNLKSHNFKFNTRFKFFLFKFKISVRQNDGIRGHWKKNPVSVKVTSPDRRKRKTSVGD